MTDDLDKPAGDTPADCAQIPATWKNISATGLGVLAPLVTVFLQADPMLKGQIIAATTLIVALYLVRDGIIEGIRLSRGK